LEKSHGDEWPRIPADIRDLLRRPLIARLYRDIALSEAWTPENEYSLYSRYWQRKLSPMQQVWVRNLARTTLTHRRYPWRTADLVAAGISDSASVSELIGAVWLRSPRHGRYALFHDRLLNWAVAEALAEDVVVGRINDA